MLKDGMIVGSNGPNRFADTPVQWFYSHAEPEAWQNARLKTALRPDRPQNRYAFVHTPRPH